MLKNIQIYGILHSTSLTIVDKRYKRKIIEILNPINSPLPLLARSRIFLFINNPSSKKHMLYMQIAKKVQTDSLFDQKNKFAYCK